MGPALGLMGTLIPLSPALAASPTATSPVEYVAACLTANNGNGLPAWQPSPP